MQNVIKLEGAFNVRDLGGYKTTDGKGLKNGVLLRSGSTHTLAENDIKTLEDMNLSLVIDLRSQTESRGKPSKLCGRTGIKYESFRMLDDFFMSDTSWGMYDSMSALYIYMLKKYGAEYKKIMHLIAKADGMTLFHCSMGKDRTGILAMLLLGLAGVPDETIVRDYAVSEKLLSEVTRRRREKLMESGISIPGFYFETKPLQMRKTLGFLKEEYGGVHGFLIASGMSETEIEAVKQKML